MASTEAICKRALEEMDKAPSPDHMAALDLFIKIGDSYTDQGKIAEAERIYKVALEGKRKLLGPEHTSTLDTAHILGVLYAKQSKMIEAEVMYKQALEGKEKALGLEHKSTLETVFNLGLVYARQGKMVGAEVMYRRALEWSEKALGLEHTLTLAIVNNLGLVYARQGKIVEAEAMCKRLLEGYERALGPRQTSTLEFLNTVGNLYSEQGRMTEADVMYRRALERKEKALGPEHNSTLESVYNLGLLYNRQGNITEAEAMYKRALEGSEKARGSEYRLTLAIINNLGNLYRNQGKLEQAEEMYRRNIQGSLKLFGPQHPSTIQAVDTLRKVSLGNCRENALRKKDLSNSIMDLVYLAQEWGTLPLDLSQKWGTMRLDLLGALGRALICSADDFNAEIAFGYQIFLKGNNWIYSCICDGCGKTLTLVTGRFVCKSCENSDVCRDCFNQSKRRIRIITGCVRHSFLKITPLFLSDSEAGVVIGGNLLSMTRQGWFESLRIKYQSASQRTEDSDQKISSSTSLSSPSPLLTTPSSTLPSKISPPDVKAEMTYRGRVKRPRRRIGSTPDGIDELQILQSSAPELVCEACQRIFLVLLQETVQTTSAHPRAKEVSNESGSIKLFSSYVPRPVSNKHQPGFAELLQSATRCMMCRLLFNGFVTRGFGRDIEADLNSTHTSQITFDDNSEVGMPNRVCGFSLENSVLGGLLTPSLVIYTKNDQIPESPLWQSPKPVNFDDALPAIKNWLENCSSSHPQCVSISGSELPALPTRVIDVGAFDGSTEPRLYVSNGRRALYIALSHCWGQCLTLTTTSATLKERIEQISMGSLPRSFQDAVLVARSLHVRYLWIDSICIVQDDKIDWERESSRMASVYQMAHVMLAATAAPNSEAGFLHPRLPALRVRFTDESQMSKSHDAHITVGSDVAYVRLNTSDEVSLKDAPLNRRAWVLQEDLLSPRTLHFAKDQLFWLCRQQAMSEEGTSLRVVSKSLARTVWGSGSLDINKRRDVWWQIVEEYSWREIKKKSDKFAALAGITSVIDERFQDKTFASQSLNDLHYDLFWDVKQEVDKPPLDKIPSWSWASLDGPVRKPYLKGPLSKRMEILDTTGLTWSGEPLTSWTAGGALKIRGPLMRTTCALEKNTVRDILEPLQRTMFIYAAVINYLSCLAEFINQNWTESLTRKIPLQRSIGKYTFDRTGSSEVEDVIWCLEVARGPPSQLRFVRPENIHMEDRDDITWSHILILKRMDPKTTTTTTITTTIMVFRLLLRLFYFILSWEMLRLGRFEDDHAGEFCRLGMGWIEIEDGKPDEKTASFVMNTLILV